MLFSDASVAKLMGDTFECAWESVRPVPRVEIDFGDGRKLTRTLQGNVATYLCTSDGRTADIIPGVWHPEQYARRLVEGARLLGTLQPDARERQVADFHRALTERGAPTPLFYAADMEKARVEEPMKDSLRPDTEHNHTVRMPRIHALLAEKPLSKPADLKAGLFRDILGYDIEDPWLGLAPDVLGGEGGRR